MNVKYHRVGLLRFIILYEYNYNNNINIVMLLGLFTMGLQINYSCLVVEAHYKDNNINNI